MVAVAVAVTVDLFPFPQHLVVAEGVLVAEREVSVMVTTQQPAAAAEVVQAAQGLVGLVGLVAIGLTVIRT